MSPEQFLAVEKPESWEGLNAIVDSLDVGSLSSWYDAMLRMNDYQLWFLVMAIQRKRQWMDPIFAIRVLDRLPPDGEGIDIADWVVKRTKPLTEELTARFATLAMESREKPGYEMIPTILVGKLASRLRKSEERYAHLVALTQAEMKSNPGDQT